MRALEGTSPLARLVAASEERVAGRATGQSDTTDCPDSLRDWPLDNARSIQKLSYRITPFDQGINRLLAGTV